MIDYAQGVIKILDATGWIQSELADEMGVEQSTVSRWKNGTVEPEAAHLKKLRLLEIKYVTDGTEPYFRLAKEPKLSSYIRIVRDLLGADRREFAQILRGNGLQIDEESIGEWEEGVVTPTFGTLVEIVKISFDQCSPDFKGKKDKLLDVLDEISELSRAIKDFAIPRGDSPPKGDEIPLISTVSAGMWTGAEDPFPIGAAEEYLYTSQNHSSGTFALRIKGNSMEPRFQDGDIVIFDPALDPSPGNFVVAKLDNEGEATFKKYRPKGTDENGSPVIDLVPLNDDWPTPTLTKQTPGRIVAVMIEHRIYRRF